MRKSLFILMVAGLTCSGVSQNYLNAQTNTPVPPGGNPASIYPANPGKAATATATNNSPTYSTVNPGTSKPNSSNPGLPGAVSSNPNNPGTIPVAAPPEVSKKTTTDQKEHSGSNPGTTQQRTTPRLNPGTAAPRTYPRINPVTPAPKNNPK